jgi:hypothetical protein
MTCQAQLRALSPTNEKPQSSIAAKGREEAGRASEQVRCLLGAAIDGGSRMREKEGKGPRGPDHPQPEFLETVLRKGVLVFRGFVGCKDKRRSSRGPQGEGEREGGHAKAFRETGRRLGVEDGESGFRGLGTVGHCFAVSPRCNLTNQPEPALCLPLVGRQQKRPLPVFGPSFECRVVRLRRSISR